VDLIYDKGHFTHDEGATLLNDPSMDQICLNKWRTYELFPDVCPKTFIIRSQEELHTVLQMMMTELIVAKPLDGEEGHGVMIASAAKIERDVQAFPYLLQEFIDTSGGIPGIVESIHDFRMICIGSEIVLCFARTPPPGKLLANVAQGGKKIEVRISDIPADALAIKDRIEREFSKFPRRVYSIDCGRTANGEWKIIELNSKPGVTCRSEGTTNVYFQESLANMLLS
jgi:glutathione synthase/RimK-type ligase-like ATP-grasp enzyme